MLLTVVQNQHLTFNLQAPGHLQNRMGFRVLTLLAEAFRNIPSQNSPNKHVTKVAFWFFHFLTSV